MASAALAPVYGTGRLLAIARDPHWLYVHWDPSEDQLRRWTAFAAAKRLSLRMHLDNLSGPLLRELDLPTQARGWFIEVGRGATDFVAELGGLDDAGAWHSLVASAIVRTPPDAIAEPAEVTFQTVAIDAAPTSPSPVPDQVGCSAPPSTVSAPLDRPLPSEPPRPEPPPLTIGPAVSLAAATPLPPPRPLAQAALPSRVAPRESFASAVLPASPTSDHAPLAPQTPPAPVSFPAASLERVGAWVSSLDVRPSAPMLSQGGQAVPVGAGQVISPMRRAGLGQGGGIASESLVGEPGAPAAGFWFNVNAELVIYGATEPDAQLTVAGRPVALRPDGTFSFRFALPDGEYELAVGATSSRGDDARSARLHFSRQTERSGCVGVHPHDKRLRPPRPEHVTP
jgi:hypothetical protein